MSAAIDWKGFRIETPQRVNNQPPNVQSEKIMSLLSNILGSALGGGNGNTGNSLLQSATALITQHGGVEGLQQKFQSNNLGHIFSSWIGTGQNQPISPEQLMQVLGHDRVQQVATQAGVSHGDAASGLAQLLPSLIDKLTPGGNVPTGGALQQGLSGLLSGGLGNLLK
jgi:uncharacterized protein YidB (DUF937 family)